MNVILYGNKTENIDLKLFKSIINEAYRYFKKVYVYEPFFQNIVGNQKLEEDVFLIDGITKLDDSADFLISFGGDGTFLDAVSLVGDSSVAMLGINMGRLGFLSNNDIENFDSILKALTNKQFHLEKTMMLSLDSPQLGNTNFALNDVYVHRTSTSGMIAIDLYADNKPVNCYWGDGLIISTPTGSTAYSLSCGGPILDPNLEAFLITPVASHGLTVRPIVILATSLELKISSRSGDFLLSKDSHSAFFSTEKKVKISKSTSYINLVRFNNQDFFKSIREKLMWGADKRKL